MPSATTVHIQLQKRSDNIKDQLLVDLSPDTKILLALDCWMSPNHLVFMAITDYFIDVNWQYHKVLLGFEHLQSTHTGESLASVLEGVLIRHNISDRILAIIIDNTSN